MHHTTISLTSYYSLFQALQEKYGGWQNISMVNYFNDFANLCFERFGNRVKYWITFNNPWVCLDRYFNPFYCNCYTLISLTHNLVLCFSL